MIITNLNPVQKLINLNYSKEIDKYIYTIDMSVIEKIFLLPDNTTIPLYIDFDGFHRIELYKNGGRHFKITYYFYYDEEERVGSYVILGTVSNCIPLHSHCHFYGDYLEHALAKATENELDEHTL